MQVVLLSLSWPHVIGDGVFQGEVAADQIATASENVPRNAKKSEQENFRDQLITSIIDTTVHYENSNGFLPMLESSSSKPPDLLDQAEVTSNLTLNNFLNDPDNSSTVDSNEEDSVEEEADKFENDPAYSTEARIFLNFPSLRKNRRSFEYQGGQNDFDLLKVRNNTPVVANYPDLYEDPSSSMENEKMQPSSRQRSRGKGKAVEGYTGNYGMISADNHNHESAYNHYYPHNSGKDKEKSSHGQEKVASNYHQQDVLSYDGHGQTRPTAASLPRTNEEANDLVKSNTQNYDVNDNVAMSSQVTNNQHRFSRPVVVADPNYNFDQLRNSASGTGDYQTSRIIDSGSSEVAHRYTIRNRDGRFRSDEDSRDMSDDTDYADYVERPRRVQKSRRRPSSVDNSKRLPKEHRGSIDDSMEYESQGKRHHSSRTKSHRQRVRGNSWVDDDRHQDQDDSYEEMRYDDRLSGSESRTKSQHNSKFKPSNSWKQVSPNLEISHSSGIEIDQLEKPKLIVPVKVNLVPLANFDHATAIGSSQGFDMSNAVLQNIVSATPVSTPTPLITTGQNIIGQDTKIRVSTPIPDIIVGQNSFQDSMQAVFPQMQDQNKYSTNLKPQYVSSTVSPVYAVTPSVNPSLQSIPIQDVQGTATARPTYVNQMQQGQGNIPQLIVPQPTVHTVPTLVQTPVQGNADFNVQVNPHGMHGQNLVNHGNFQLQSFPTMSTVTPTSHTVPITKFNLVTAESQGKKTLVSGSTANFLASASLAVGQGDQRQPLNGNSYYLQNSNTQQIVKPQLQGGVYQQVLKNVNVAPKTKTYIQTTHLLPAVLQPMPTLATFSASTPQVFPEQNFVLQQPRDQQFVKIPGTGIDSGMKNVKVQPFAYQTLDNVGSQSTTNFNTLSAFPSVSGVAENAHLPYVGTRNVEIVNPNIKPSPVDTAVVNAYETMHYPTAVLTTPFPMFTTTSVVTTRPFLSTTDSSNAQSFNNQFPTGDMKAYQSQDRPMFNPINFVPNIDVMKNQNALNSKLHANEPLQHNLNLVPLVPGGNFFKPSLSAQSDLLVKPKLTSDLETYAEQMFKESLKTIYNSQKWNNDRKPGNSRQNVSDSMDLAKLKNALQHLRASLSDSKRNKDPIEGHHSETKLQTAELPSKKPDELLAALEQMLKTHPSDPLHMSYGSGRPHRHRRPADQDKFKFGPGSDFRDTKHVRDFMSPSQSGSHRPKGHYHDKPGKKRPISGPNRYSGQSHFHGPRSHSRHNLSPKTGGLDVSATNVEPVHAEGSKFEPMHDSRHHHYREFKKGSSIDSYPSFTTPLPDKHGYPKGTKHQKGGKEYGINHPKTHNFLGLLMKNKQLPVNGNPNYFRDPEQLQQFFEDEKQRLQQQLYDDSLKDYLYKMSEGAMYSSLGQSAPDARRSLTQKGV
ncbi:uncharacterized protein LOC143376554 [Andrena cerasifolii]|uniref:uncharacterized protein LOC143376554 n=1 Tax=Andrena cerasifolii TaxID=2819439 RepID=UPI0040383B2A